MNIGTIFAKWFWAVCIVVTLLNAANFWRRGQKRMRTNPELEPGYRKLVIGFAAWSNIPWVVMGIGCLVGHVPTVFHFFRPRDGNPYVFGFFGSIVLLWLLGTYWVVFTNGAEMLAKHPGLFNCELKNPTVIKLLWLLGVAGGVWAVVMMFTKEFHVPRI